MTDPRLKRAGVSGFNKPKRTPQHKTKSHVVVAKQGNQIKTIRFGQQGVRGAGKNPKTEIVDSVHKSIEGGTMSIPFDETNKDYQEYKEWLAEGNTPEVAD